MSRKKRRLPLPDGYTSIRKFRADKRAQLDRLELAASNFAFGCALIPGYPRAIHKIHTAIRRLRDETSIKRWGR